MGSVSPPREAHNGSLVANHSCNKVDSLQICKAPEIEESFIVDIDVLDAVTYGGSRLPPVGIAVSDCLCRWPVRFYGPRERT